MRCYKDGAEVHLKSPQDAIRARIGFVPEDRLSEGLFLPRSIADNVVISEIDRLASGVGVLEPRQSAARRSTAGSRGWPSPPRTRNNACSTLSGGNQQRIVLAKWLACNPDVLVLNGPTVGVDIGSKHDIHAILQRLANEGMAIIIISDDLPEVLENCSRLLVLKAGRVVKELLPADTNEQEVLSYML